MVQNYGGAAGILNDTVMALTRRKKPAANDCPDRYLYTSAIIAALQRLEKLICSNPALGIKAKGVFTTFDHSDPESEDEVSTSAYVVAGHSN